MAAPTEAYQTYRLNDDTLNRHYSFAKLTSPYGTVSDAKTTFKLDGVINEGTSSFIGYVTPNSINSKYHNSVRIDTSLFTGMSLLYDGGLNTLGFITAYNKTSNFTAYTQTNSITFPQLNFKGAYYVATSGHGLAWKKTGTNTWNYASKGTLTENQTADYTNFSVDVDITNTLFIEAPYSYDVAPYITNVEGTILLDGNSGTGETLVSKSVTAFGYPVTYNYSESSVSDAYMNGAESEVYMTRRAMIVGSRFMSDASGATPDPSDGIYLYMTPDGQGQRTYYVLESGLVTAVELWNPTTGLQYHVPYMYLSDTLQNAWNGADALNFETTYNARARYTSDNGGEWYFYSDPSETEYGVFLIQVIRADEQLPYNFTNDTKYWVETNSSFKVIDFNVPNDDLAAYVASIGTVIT